MSKSNTPKRRPTTEMTRDHMVEVAETLKVKCSHEMPYHTDTTITPASDRINDRELKSVYALLAYVSYNQNVRQDTVQMIVEAQFGVDHVSKLRRQDYMHAIEFLVDMKMEEIMN